MTFVEGGRRLASPVSTVGEDDVFWNDARLINKTTVEYYAFLAEHKSDQILVAPPQKAP